MFASLLTYLSNKKKKQEKQVLPTPPMTYFDPITKKWNVYIPAAIDLN